MKTKIHKKLPTLTIGIPAYNEEKNIGKLLSSIFQQTQTYFELKEVLVVSDGSTDKTEEIVRSYQQRFTQIRLIKGKRRLGKAQALNTMYRHSDTDLLFTIDADILFLGVKNLDYMTKEITKNPNLNMVGPLHFPTRSKTFFGNLARYSYLTIRDAALKIDNGNNFYGCMSCEFMRKNFYKSFSLPKGTISDQCYVYAMAIKNGKSGFMLVKRARVIFGVAQTFHDWRVLSARAVVGDKADLVRHFGKEVLRDYFMPKHLLIPILLTYFLENPIYLVGSVLMNIYIRKFPYKKDAPKNGMWNMVTSSKEVKI